MKKETNFLGLYVTEKNKGINLVAISDSGEMLHCYETQFKMKFAEYGLSTEIREIDISRTDASYQEYMLMWFDDNIVLTEKEYSMVLDWLNEEWYSYIHMVGMMKRYQQTMNFDRDTVAKLEKLIFDMYNVIKSYKVFINNIKPEAILNYLDWTPLELNPILKEIADMKRDYKLRMDDE